MLRNHRLSPFVLFLMLRNHRSLPSLRVLLSSLVEIIGFLRKPQKAHTPGVRYHRYTSFSRKYIYSKSSAFYESLRKLTLKAFAIISETVLYIFFIKTYLELGPTLLHALDDSGQLASRPSITLLLYRSDKQLAWCIQSK